MKLDLFYVCKTLTGEVHSFLHVRPGVGGSLGQGSIWTRCYESALQVLIWCMIRHDFLPPQDLNGQHLAETLAIIPMPRFRNRLLVS